MYVRQFLHIYVKTGRGRESVYIYVTQFLHNVTIEFSGKRGSGSRPPTTHSVLERHDQYSAEWVATGASSNSGLLMRRLAAAAGTQEEPDWWTREYKRGNSRQKWGGR